jgi:hypothetical protein
MLKTKLAAPLLLVALAALGAPHGAAAGAKPPVTNLLFSFVTNQAGFDTGFAIANTTADPFGTTPQDGACTLTFFGANAPAPFVTPAIVAGTVYVNLASSLAPSFQGYMIAECDFPLAHGFAFVSDIGAQDVAMGSLALVIPPRARKGGERLDH